MEGMRKDCVIVDPGHSRGAEAIADFRIVEVIVADKILFGMFGVLLQKI